MRFSSIVFTVLFLFMPVWAAKDCVTEGVDALEKKTETAAKGAEHHGSGRIAASEDHGSGYSANTSIDTTYRTPDKPIKIHSGMKVEALDRSAPITEALIDTGDSNLLHVTLKKDPNSMHDYFLYDSQGQILKSGPDKIMKVTLDDPRLHGTAIDTPQGKIIVGKDPTLSSSTAASSAATGQGNSSGQSMPAEPVMPTANGKVIYQSGTDQKIPAPQGVFTQAPKPGSESFLIKVNEANGEPHFHLVTDEDGTLTDQYNGQPPRINDQEVKPGDPRLLSTEIIKPDGTTVIIKEHWQMPK